MSKRKNKSSAKKTVRAEKKSPSFLKQVLRFFLGRKKSAGRIIALPKTSAKPLKKHELKVVTQKLKQAQELHSRKVELMGMQELFRQTAARHNPRKSKVLPSAKLLDKVAKKSKKVNIPVQSTSGDFDGSVADLLEYAAPVEEGTIEPTVLSFHEEAQEEAPAAVEFGNVVTADKPAPSGIKKMFFLHLPLSLGSRKSTRGKITSASASKQRQEAPLNISADEVRQLKGLPEVEPEPVVQTKTKKSKKKEVTEEKTILAPVKKKKETANEKEAHAKEDKARAAELKEMERINKNRRTALRAQKTTGLQQFLSAIAHFGLGKERNLFTQNLATMLNAGLPLIDAIRILKIETKTRAMKKMIQR